MIKKLALLYQVDLQISANAKLPPALKKNEKYHSVHTVGLLQTEQQWPVLESPSCLEASSRIFSCSHLPLFGGFPEAGAKMHHWL